MSDGTSDRGAYHTEHEKWTEVEGIRLTTPIDVWFHHFRGVTVAECIVLAIEFHVSRWGDITIDDNDGGAPEAVALVGRNAEQIARDAMKKLMVKRLATDRYKKYVKKG